MLIVSDFIQKAKQNDIFVGTGRGSVCGSMVGFLLNIHSVDPMKYGLLFERFHNKEKKAFPDIDTDFSPDGRDWVLNYISEKYGKERVAHVSNLSRMTPKVVITDIARSMEIGGSKSKAFEIAKKITETISTDAKTTDEALKTSKEFTKYCTEYPELETYGRKLVGLEKAYATHAAGIVIGDVDLSTYVPLRMDKNGDVSVQYEKNRCEEMGLIKMDLLGLEHLRILKNTIDNVKKLGDTCLMPEQLPLDDEKVWKDISKGKTMCIFQMESSHMKSLCKQVQPKNIEDLSVVNALGRPSAGQRGENGERPPRDTYIAIRSGREEMKIKYPQLQNSLGTTLGICMYEEQLMTLAKDIAGWSLNEADQLRKITKLKEKGKELAQKVENKFIIDAQKNGMEKEAVRDIWDNIILPYVKYGFNKSHSIAYSINGYHTAYYKHHYQTAFMAAVLKAENDKGSSPDRGSNVREYKKEAKRLGINVVPPDINSSEASFSVRDKNTITTGLEAVKGVGFKAVSNILETRDKHPFTSFSDFLYRTKSSLVRKDVIQPLAQAGCFDCFGITRKAAFTFFGDIRTKANKFAAEKEALGIPDYERLKDFKFEKPEMADEWEKKEKVQGEIDVLGESVSGTINDLYDGFFTGEGTEFSRIKMIPDSSSIRVEAIITDVKQDKLKSGKNKGRTYAKFTITDINNDLIQMTVWSDKWGQYKEILQIGKPMRAICKINEWNNAKSLVLERIEKIG
jgi:DNA polymerase-3 subunit alpha